MSGLKRIAVAAMAGLGLVALSGAAWAQSKQTIGIAMPTKSSARWIDDGNNMVKVLKERGYNTDLQYAEDDIPNQLSQIENMVTKGAKVLVIAAIDGTTLSDVLKQAKDKGLNLGAAIEAAKRFQANERASLAAASFAPVAQVAPVAAIAAQA